MTAVAIVGQGYMGQTHAASWTALGQHVKYVCTPRPRGPMEAAPNARIVTDLAAVLADPEVEIVSVCTPTTTHRGITVAALEAGKHVLLEKPITLSIDDALAIRDAAALASGSLMVAQVVRFFGGHVLLREDVEAGRLGRIVSARARRLLQRPDWADWLADESKSGGAIVDLAIHDFDQMNLFLGRPVSVTSHRVGTNGPFETTIEYADGGLGQVLSHADHAPGAPFTAGISLVGEAGLADYEISGASPTQQEGTTSYPGVNTYRLATAGGGYSREITGDDPYTRQAEYFLEQVGAGEEPALSTVASSIRALEVALAARESLETGQRVDVDSTVSDEEATGHRDRLPDSHGNRAPGS